MHYRSQLYDVGKENLPTFRKLKHVERWFYHEVQRPSSSVFDEFLVPQNSVSVDAGGAGCLEKKALLQENEAEGAQVRTKFEFLHRMIF